MSHDPLFDTNENKALLVLCARRTIRNIGIGGIIWGVINLVLGVVALHATWLNIGLVLLGWIMLGAGMYAMAHPSLDALLIEAIVSLLLFCWNLGISILNAMGGDSTGFNPRGLVFPVIVAFLFFREYKKLGYLGEAIRTIDAQTVARATAACKELLRKKLKEEPAIAEAASKKCRVQFLTDSAFCVQHDLQRAFQMSLPDFHNSIKDINAKKLQITVQHPLGRLAYAFDQKNSEKIRGWLGAPAQPV